MVDLIVYAIPAFVLLLAVEAISFRVAAREDLKGYEARDTRTSLSTFNPSRVTFHEWAAVWRDVRAADRWRDRLGYVFGGPAWKPEVSGRGAARPDALPAPGGGGSPPPSAV